MEFLTSEIFFNNPLIDWIYFLVAITATILFTSLISSLLINILTKASKKTKNRFDDALVDMIRSPLKFALRIIGLYISVLMLILPKSLETIIFNTFDSLFVFSIFWVLHSSIDILESYFNSLGSKLSKKLSIEILNFISKAIKVFIILLGIMSILQQWGINVSAFVASLGLGGLAFALAAKDTAANLFGSMVILADKPFSVGDWIKTPDVEGTIVEIGIRSTKVRTFAQALVTVPNANLANSAIINWSRMGKRRIKTTIGLTYDTNSQQIKAILSDLKSYLEAHESIDNDTIFINFSGFAESSLDIFCYFFTKTTKWGEFMNIREEVFLEFMSIIEKKHKATFAFPSRTLYMQNSDMN